MRVSGWQGVVVISSCAAVHASQAQEPSDLEGVPERAGIALDHVRVFGGRLRLKIRLLPAAVSVHRRRGVPLLPGIAELGHHIWSSMCWRYRQKSRARCMLRLFLEAALPDKGCVANFVQDLWGDGKSFCQNYAGGDDCAHVALGDLPDLQTSGSAAGQAVDSLCVLMPHVAGCAGGRHDILCAVDAFQQRIDRFICEQRRETLPHKVPPRQHESKGVMADDTFREYAANKVIQQRRANTVKAWSKWRASRGLPTMAGCGRRCAHMQWLATACCSRRTPSSSTKTPRSWATPPGRSC